jgi:hypothetical protein
MIKCDLVISNDRIACLQKNLGKENITVEYYEPDYSKVKFEVKDQMDVLYIFHAGIDAGLAFGLYGSYSPASKIEDKEEVHL